MAGFRIIGCILDKGSFLEAPWTVFNWQLKTDDGLPPLRDTLKWNDSKFNMVTSLENQAMGETVLFQTADGSVWVTPTRATLREKTYQLSLITMVRADRVRAKRAWAITLTFVGILLAIGAFSADSSGGGFFGVLMAIIGGLALAMLKDTHRVVFANASGQDAAAYQSKSKHDVNRIVAAINEAMARRGMSYGQGASQAMPQQVQQS